MAMEVIHSFLNLAAPIFTFFSLCLLLPPYYAFKSFLSVLASVLTEDVSGKVVLITGASSGVGEHLAYEYARRGACLALAARREASLREVAHVAMELGAPDAIVIRADVSEVDDCKRLVSETFNHYGRLDHLVNNAGVASVCMFEDVTDITTFKAVMDTNYWGSVYTTHFAVPHLRNSKGKIIVLSDAISWLPQPRMSIYSASKAALLSMFETLRVELGPEIGITIVMPGFMESEITQGKHLTREGKMEVDQDLVDVQIGIFPVPKAEGCAKSIVDSACRGDRYLTVPNWSGTTYLWKVFCPELIEWSSRFMFSTSPRAPPTEAMSKKLVDLLGIRKLFHPSSLLSPRIKTE